MCDPVSAMVALSVVTAGVGIKTQYDQAKAQQGALDAQAQHQAEELAAQRDDEIGARMRAARQAAARRLVAAGEAGVAGQSTGIAILNDFGQANQDAAKVAKQAAFADRANQDQYRAALSNISKPNGFSAGLQIANAGLSGYVAGTALKGSMAGKGLKIGTPKT
jgi:hypothetical protein